MLPKQLRIRRFGRENVVYHFDYAATRHPPILVRGLRQSLLDLHEQPSIIGDGLLQAEHEQAVERAHQ